jgi:hypothetical protein
MGVAVGGGKVCGKGVEAIGRQVPQIALLRSAKAEPSPFLNKAETLLTRHWAAASWQAREEILRSVKWLLSLVSLARVPSTLPAIKARARRVAKRHRRVPLQV